MRFRSLKTTVFFFSAMLAIAPLVIVGLLLFHMMSNNLSSVVTKDQSLLARVLAAHVDAFLRQPVHILTRIADMAEEPDRLDAGLLDRVLDLEADRHYFETIFLTDARGTSIHVGLPPERTALRNQYLGLDLSLRPFFIAARGKPNPWWSDPFVSLITGELSMTVSISRHDTVTVGSFSLDRLKELTAFVSGEGGNAAAIIDRRGNVIFSSDPALPSQGQNLSNLELVRQGFQGRLETRRYLLSGSEWLGSVAPVGKTGWVVLVSEKTATAFELVKHMRLIVMLGVLISALAAAVLAVLFSTGVTWSLRHLVRETDKIASGDYKRDVSVYPYEEINALADGFRRMTDAIVKREISLSESEARLQAIVDNSPAAVYVKDTEGRYVLANEHLALLAGRQKHEVIGKTPFDIFPEDKAREVARQDRQVMESGKPMQAQIVLSLQGKLRTYISVKFPLRSADGNITAVCGISTDITDTLKEQREKKNLQAQLLHAQKMESVGRLAGGVAHDFNNLLSSIIGYAELAQLKLPPDHPAAAHLKIVQSSGEKAAGLTRQLLAFSRKQVLEMRSVDLNVVVRDMSKLLMRLIGEDIQLTLNIDTPVSPIVADPGQIDQVLMNLAVNARDAMPRGGNLVLETADTYLDEHYASRNDDVSPGPYVMLAVTDSGVGMSKAVQESIFEPFFTTKGVGKGTGLGLATVYGIVKQHGGHISLSSEEGVGTTFKIYFPVSARGMEEPGILPEPKARPGTETILVVDDEASIRNLITETLQPLGYRLLQAPDGDTALEIAGSEPSPIHLLITDVVMPGMRGQELAVAFHALHPKAGILIMSGYTDGFVPLPETLEERVEFMHKPLTPSNLIGKLHQLFAHPDGGN